MKPTMLRKQKESSSPRTCMICGLTFGVSEIFELMTHEEECRAKSVMLAKSLAEAELVSACSSDRDEEEAQREREHPNDGYIKFMNQLTKSRNEVREHLAAYMEKLPHDVSNNTQICKAYKQTCRNNHHQICIALDQVYGVQRAMLYKHHGADLKSPEMHWPGTFWLNKTAKCLNCSVGEGPYCKKCL